MKRFAFILGLAFFGCSQQPPSLPATYHPTRKILAPLPHAAFAPLPLGCIRPTGWLEKQLRIQADGLSGHIEEIWPDLGPNNAWRGGRGDAWERGPYYLDGLVPLAFELGDSKLLARMQGWMDWNLEHQRPDGGLGPDWPRDWWPDMVFLKALAQYGEGSGDERVEPAIRRYAAYVKAQLPARRLDAWRAQRRYDEIMRGDEDLVGASNRWQYYRWTEMVLDLLWLYQRTNDAELLALAKEFKSEGYDWDAHFKNFKFKEKWGRDRVYLANHGVNNAMGIKAGALGMLLGSKAQPLVGFDTLNRWHGQANGAFSADEQLAGLSPSQGTELCVVVEEMFSLETMLWSTGEPRLGDALENLAFNALPAAFDEGMWTHQYDQQVNQVMATVARRDWSNNGERANIFGLEPEWGCCTANYHQGWPKFVESLWMAAPDGGLAAMSYAPCQVSVVLPSGQGFGIEVTGDYPFGKEVTLKIHAAQPQPLPLRLRIPAWATASHAEAGGQRYEGSPGKFIEIKRSFSEGDEIRLSLSMPPVALGWQGHEIVKRGPLLFALEIPYALQQHGKDSWSDRELTPLEPWNLALKVKAGEAIPESSLEFRPATGNAFDRNETPLRLHLQARRAGNWAMDGASAAPPPAQAVAEGPELTAQLIPYGAAKLRIAVFPGAY